MDRLAKEDRRIEQATARAEVKFREKERCAEWEQQPLDLSTWRLGEPTAQLPGYWEPTAEYAATIILTYAQAAVEMSGRDVMGPSQFERFMSTCPRGVAEAVYSRKMARYARVRWRSIGLVVGKLKRDALQRIATEVKDLEDGVWKRHRDAICCPISAERAAEPSTSDGPEESSVSTDHPAAGAGVHPDRKAPAEHFEAYRAKNPTMSYKIIADRIGISYDSLFTIFAAGHRVLQWRSVAKALAPGTGISPGQSKSQAPVMTFWTASR